jgi:hypothetical protein
MYRPTNGRVHTITLLEAVIIQLRHCIWVGLIISPIVGWQYAQARLSGRLAVGILSIVAIMEIGYLLIELVAFLLSSGAPASMFGG